MTVLYNNAGYLIKNYFQNNSHQGADLGALTFH